MKKGFFSLLAMLLLCNIAMANVSTGETPQGDVEDFFNKVKAACEDPDSVGNQKPPENIMFKCTSLEKIWMPGKPVKSRLLKQWRALRVSIYCDKDVGDLEEWFKHPMTPVKAPCPRYNQYLVKKSIAVQGMSCDDIEDIDSIVEFCEEKLEEADPEAKPTGRSVDFCGKGPGQKPPHPPKPPSCDVTTWPPPEHCCDGTVMPRPPVCDIPEPPVSCDVTTWPPPEECCDGSVEPRPPVCDIPEPPAPICDGSVYPVPEACCEPSTSLPQICVTPALVMCGPQVRPKPEHCTKVCEQVGAFAPRFCCDGSVTPIPGNCRIRPPNKCDIWPVGNPKEWYNDCCTGEVTPEPPLCMWFPEPDPEPVCDGSITPTPPACCDGTVTPTPPICTPPQVGPAWSLTNIPNNTPVEPGAGNFACRAIGADGILADCETVHISTTDADGNDVKAIVDTMLDLGTMKVEAKGDPLRYVIFEIFSHYHDHDGYGQVGVRELETVGSIAVGEEIVVTNITAPASILAQIKSDLKRIGL